MLLRFAGALLAVLLGASTVEATVYVWRHPEGTLVLTNDADDVREASEDALTTYTTSSSSEGASQESGESAASRTAAAERSPTAGPGGASETSAASARQATKRAAREGAATSRTLGATAEQQRGAAASRTLGATAEQQRSAATNAPAERQAIDPRELLELAADPPQVIVSIVGASTQPLSTSDRATSLRNDDLGANGRTGLGGANGRRRLGRNARAALGAAGLDRR